jgi:hypothetical protein
MDGGEVGGAMVLFSGRMLFGVLAGRRGTNYLFPAVAPVCRTGMSEYTGKMEEMEEGEME